MHATQNGERYQSLVGVCFSLFKTDFNSGCPISLFKTDFNFGCPNEAVVGDTLNGPLRLVATVVPLYPFKLSNAPIPHSIATSGKRSSPMEGEPQRWAATYTKHLKQKRKTYHDGAILLYPDSGHLVLLDNAGDTLESWSLRASEEVSARAALSFHSYLVDIGEPQACPAGSRSSSPAAAASRTSHRGGAKARPPSAAGRFNPRVPRAFVNPLKSRGAGGGWEGEAAGSDAAGEVGSRFQGLRATCSTCVLRSVDVHALDELVVSFAEWTVLYTSQMTQKAKKYHDGVVRLLQAGPRVKQVRSIIHLMVICSRACSGNWRW
jgi:hypothetical protein